MTVLDLLFQKRTDILRTATTYGARNIRVFGSVARRSERPDSDIDLLVEMEPGRSYLDFVGLAQQLEDVIGRKVDLLSDGGVSPYLRERIYAEARPL